MLSVHFTILLICFVSFTYQTTIPPAPKGSCFYNNQLYRNGEIINQHKCGGSKCVDGHVLIWDNRCAFGSTKRPTHRPSNAPTATVPQGRCFYNNKWFNDGEIIFQHKCGGSKCSGGHVLMWDNHCAFGSTKRPTNRPSNPPTATVPQGRCFYNNKWFNDGEIIFKHKCGGSKCSGGHVLMWDNHCAFGSTKRPTQRPTQRPTHRPTTVPQGRCFYHGKWFENNAIIYKHRCWGAKCRNGKVLYWDNPCAYRI